MSHNGAMHHPCAPTAEHVNHGGAHVDVLLGLIVAAAAAVAAVIVLAAAVVGVAVVWQ